MKDPYRLRFLLPPLLWAALIFFLSSRSNLPGIPVVQSDKVAHLGAFGVFGFLLARAWSGAGERPARAALFAALAVSLYGATDELHQYFTPHRSADVWDWVADSVGGLLGGALWVLVLRRVFKGVPT